MDIHKPKPWRGLREFVKEIGTIVIGVLIALGGEQLVETLHWRHRLDETRTQLNQELGVDATNSLRWLTNAPCLDAQLAALRTAIGAARRAGTFHAPAHAYTPTLTMFTSEAWLNARSLQISDHMTPQAQRLYSSAFFFPIELAGNVVALHNMAGELDPLSQDFDRVSPSEAGEWAARIGRTQELQTRMELAMIYTVERADTLHAPIDLASAQKFAASWRQREGACAGDPAAIRAVAQDNSLSDQQKFTRLGLLWWRKP